MNTLLPDADVSPISLAGCNRNRPDCSGRQHGRRLPWCSLVLAEVLRDKAPKWVRPKNGNEPKHKAAMRWLSVIGSSMLAAMFALSAPLGFAQDAGMIIQRSVEANNADWKAAPEYNYVERDRDATGGTKTYEERMILGSPYERLIAVDGKPLSPQEQTEEQGKLAAAIADRQKESQQERVRRIAKYEQGRERDHLLMEQLTKALDFKLVGEQKMGPYEVYVLKATPRPGYQPPNIEAKVLTGMEGTLWVDQKTFQWVKVVANVIHPVSIEGFLATVEPGTRFELEKMPVTSSLWLPQHFQMKASAKVLFFFNHRSQENETYSGYHRASSGNETATAAE